MSIRREIYYKGFDGEWWMDINWDNTIKVTFNPNEDEYGPGERIYDIPENIIGIEHDVEYVSLKMKDGATIQFKFEIDGAFIGDIIDKEGMFVESFACFSFWDWDGIAILDTGHDV
jgi:hypothetical protein